MMQKAGLKVTAAFDNHQATGLAIHEMRTARMGRDPKTSVTYMALTARASDYAVKEMKKLNL